MTDPTRPTPLYPLRTVGPKRRPLVDGVAPREAVAADPRGLSSPPGGADHDESGADRRCLEKPDGPDSPASSGGTAGPAPALSSAHTAAMLDCIVDGLTRSVWLLAGKNYRVSADLLERVVAKVQEESEGDRRRATAETRARAAREGLGS